jgi:uncharacterized protein (DUF1800 family)
VSARKAKPKRPARGSVASPRRHRLRVPPAVPVTPTKMSVAMVDRLFWRAGFGPAEADRQRWAGQKLSDAVEWLLTAPADLAGPAPTRDGKPLDPTGDDTDLVLSWIDRMVRTRNPFAERMVFFWHRHWANSRQDVSPPQLLLRQSDLFRRYASFANPALSFRELAYEITEDPAMLRYLTGESNVRGAPNENYARELMELFCLGVVNAAGKPNYSENDVKQLAKALSGWQVDDGDPDRPRAYFTTSRWYNGPKIVFGKFGNHNDRGAVDLVLGHPAHAPFFVRKLWGEFITASPDSATVARLADAYVKSGLKLKPLLQAVLTHPALFASLDEPDLVKPPIVYVVGAMRAVGAGVTGPEPADFSDEMGQVPYFPPTVAGWEGGLSWLNTNTALARVAFVGSLLAKATIDDIPGEDAAGAYGRALGAVGSPWLAASTQAAIRDYSARAAASTSKLRKERQLMLRALMLAGPDAQVM